MNAIDFLINEHNKVRSILTDIDQSNDYSYQRVLFDKLCNDLLRHEKMEEEIWYPHFKHSDKLDDTVKHLVREEKDAEKAIKKLREIEAEGAWEEKFKKFKADVEHHASEEEEKLFPIVKKILSEETLKQVGEDMRQFKLEYTGT